ncbi:MAG: hypothetical protein KAH56_04645 [Candidatus Krumholzibacteria bacterium]|nr:hypothetical protein [Candidatus Krumholzibacteria bacterium]
MVSNKMIVTFMLIAIASLAFTGCSDDNPVTTVIPADTAPPAVPANLSVDYSADMAVVNWDISTVDNDLAGYVVTRERYGIIDTLVNTPVLISSYEDTNPLSGSSLYHVYAVDHAGNESAVATVSLTITLGHQASDLTQ